MCVLSDIAVFVVLIDQIELTNYLTDLLIFSFISSFQVEMFSEIEKCIKQVVKYYISILGGELKMLMQLEGGGLESKCLCRKCVFFPTCKRHLNK